MGGKIAFSCHLFYQLGGNDPWNRALGGIGSCKLELPALMQVRTRYLAHKPESGLPVTSSYLHRK